MKRKQIILFILLHVYSSLMIVLLNVLIKNTFAIQLNQHIVSVFVVR